MTRLLLARPLPRAASGRPAVLRDQLLPTGASGATAGPVRRRQTRDGGTGLAGRILRLIQTGNVQSYAFFFALGVTVIIYYVVVR